jgi:prepilin-type N-terminal cleavage/methylation domain-containing protein
VFSLQASCQTARLARAGFTLLELLVVISIIGILASALVVSVQSGYKQARQTNCKSNLRQFGVSLTIYRGEHDNNVPNWISNLYPDYVDDRALYVCRADKGHGLSVSRPTELVALINGANASDSTSFRDNYQNTVNTRNPNITACSYMYEFSAATTAWTVPNHTLPAPHTMRDYKFAQMSYGDQANVDTSGNPLPYSASRIPIIRCYHHYLDQKVICHQNSTSGEKLAATKKDYITINVAYAGNVFVGPTWWEGTIYPGEAANAQ